MITKATGLRFLINGMVKYFKKTVCKQTDKDQTGKT